LEKKTNKRSLIVLKRILKAQPRNHNKKGGCVNAFTKPLSIEMIWLKAAPFDRP
jgi:hypothetical protein